MFLIEVESEFSAAHAIAIRGERERIHGHNFRVTVAIAGERLDDDGLLCDFHEVERHLAEVVGPFKDGDLNGTPPFDRRNPTAERIAEHIAVSLSERLGCARRADLWIESVRVTEATGCAATCRPGRPSRAT